MEFGIRYENEVYNGTESDKRVMESAQDVLRERLVGFSSSVCLVRLGAAQV